MYYGTKPSKKLCLLVAVCLLILLSINLVWSSFYSTGHHDLNLPALSLGFNQQLSNRERNDKIISSLSHQVDDLKRLLEAKTQQLEKAKYINTQSEYGGNIDILDELPDVFQDGDLVMHFVNEKIKNSDILNAAALKNENEVNHFTLFNSRYIYQLDSELNKKPQSGWSGRRELRRELFEIIKEGVQSLNDDPLRTKVSPTYHFTEKDFLHGLFRTEKGTGTQYELVFKPGSSANIMDDTQLFRIRFFRPFAPLRKIAASSVAKTETIHFIVPLSGRADTFRVFVDYFKEDALPDKHVQLTVVYYGNEGLSEVKEILNAFELTTGFSDFKLVTVNDQFSRGKALQRGADSLDSSSNPLMFFCDVDLAFTKDFLNQCRAYSSPGSLVFFPIVFSLYNPAVIYDNSAIPSLRNRQQIKRDHGFWRDFGYGMSCQYLSDFRDIGGFDLSIQGWGTEDLRLYRKYTQSTIGIVRTPVNSLFHHWHPKFCDKSWSKEQYESCLKSRIRNEGSVLQLGRKYYELKEKLESKALR